MKIIDKFKSKSENMHSEAAPVIAFLGDSVTHGCFELYMKNENDYETVYDSEFAYHKYLKRIFAKLFPNVQLTVVNAGISGGNAVAGLERLERDVLRYRPDLTVVCFGLNDAVMGESHRQKYIDSLKEIFCTLHKNGSEVIFMTPNMMNTNISCHIQNERFKGIAEHTMKIETSGHLESLLEDAKKLAKEMNVPVCDCYAKWKRLSQGGVDITELLSNKINHPDREMNWMFAYSLVETMFEN